MDDLEYCENQLSEFRSRASDLESERDSALAKLESAEASAEELGKQVESLQETIISTKKSSAKIETQARRNVTDVPKETCPLIDKVIDYLNDGDYITLQDWITERCPLLARYMTIPSFGRLAVLLPNTEEMEVRREDLIKNTMEEIREANGNLRNLGEVWHESFKEITRVVDDMDEDATPKFGVRRRYY